MRGKRMGRAIAVVAGCMIGAMVYAEAPEFTPAVTDVTVFKDGHALVMERAKVKLDNGWCRTREVPAPLLGAFWAFTPDKDCAVDFVRAGTVELKENRSCLTIDDILQANIGKQVSIVAQLPGAPPVTYSGTLIGIFKNKPQEGAQAGEASAERSAEPALPELASFVMIEEGKSVRMIKREHVVSLTMDDPSTAMPPLSRTQNEISLHVAGAQGKPAGAEGNVGIVYIQKGIRWIPDYRVELLDGGQARVTLQGVVINELADLDNVNLRLVVGVPSFIMKDTLSPLALREAAPKLSSYFAPSGPGGRSAGFNVTNAMLSQAAGNFEGAARDEAGFGAPPEAAPGVPMEGQKEDLYFYHQAGVTLKKGERAAIKLLEVTVPYEDIYKYELPPVPPLGARENLGQEQINRIASALSAAKVMHVIRLTNNGDAPWTTGPATIFKSGDPLAQQMLTYTSVKNDADLTVTVATDLNPKREENEVGRREPNSISLNGQEYSLVKMHGKLTFASFKDKPARLIAVRKVLGTVTEASGDGKIKAVNPLEESPFGGEENAPYIWPWWSFMLNPISVITWDATVPAGKSVTYEYDWQYYQNP